MEGRKMTYAAPPAEAVGPLVRGLRVLRGLAEAGGRGSARGLARETGLARATVDRVLLTLERLGHLRTEERDIALAPRAMELGNAYLTACRFPDLLGPLADRLADELDESVSITVPDREGVRSVREATRRRAMSVALRVGELLPAERGGGGALFAAGWSEAEWRYWRESGCGGEAAGSFAERAADAGKHGWSVEDRLEPGLVAVAMPVRDGDRGAVCAVNVISHTSRHSAESLRKAVLPRLRKAVALMEETLASSTPGHLASSAPGHLAPPAPGDMQEGASRRGGADAAARMRAFKQELGADFLESLARGLGVLAALVEPLPLSAVAAATGLPRATARRALITLVHLGYVTSDDGLFRPTPRVLELGFAHLAGLTLPEIAQPHLAALVERVKDSASMAVLAGDDIQYVARVPTVRLMSVDITLGTRFPAHATSMGRVLLAGLPAHERVARLEGMDFRALTSRTVTSAARLGRLLEQVGWEGYCLVEEELEEGLRSIAVPVRDGDGRVLAAINVAMHASRRTADEARESVLPELRDAAARIEDDLHVVGRHVVVRTS
jgi:IclR family pca regulon transcriptional regulator